jgi:uncharacterized protein (TIGR04255 family)
MKINNPFSAPLPPEVELHEAPLVRVIAQLRFPLVVSIENQDFIAPFQEAIRMNYPILRLEQAQELMIGPSIMAPVGRAIWRFSNTEDNWRVSLSSNFMALETTAYTSRSAFLARFKDLLAALYEHIKLKVVDRLGLRYIDRVTYPALDDIAMLVRKEVLGVIGTSLADKAYLSMSETIFDLQNAQLLARWGTLPRNATVDPSALEPLDEASWILDLDMFSTNARSFDVEKLLHETRLFSERLYTFFRWAVTDEFLQRYKGNDRKGA